ncbi:MAG TPA: aspartate carbamoyltransferase catalytic subunit [Aliiroseovarius sp.]|nr:aspartate carbamoyltransferase catalytic subunit [Aliiroseovarius sp.]
MQSTGWEGILDAGEKILWQGRPDTRIHIKLGNIFTMIFGLSFAGFALFWMVMAASAGGAFWMFGLIHFTAGLAIILGPIFWTPYKRRRTWYTLTDRRAIIATDLPFKGKQLKSYPIDDATMLDFSPGDPASITFAQERRRGSKGRTYTVDIGFEYIGEGDKVYRLMRDIQQGDRQAVESARSDG